MTNAFFRLAYSTGAALLWSQLAYAAALCTAAAFLHFAHVYPHPSRTRALPLALAWASAVLISGLAFVPGAIIQTVDVQAGRILTAPGVHLVALFMLGAAGWAFALLFRNQAHLRGRARAQARYVLYGSALAAVLGFVFNLLLPLLGNYRWVWLGPLCSLVFVGCCAYSIVAHRLFDVRLLIRRTLVYSSLLTLLAGSFAVAEQGTERLLRPVFGHGDAFSADLLAALLVGFAVDPLKRSLHTLVSRHLFKNESREEPEA